MMNSNLNMTKLLCRFFKEEGLYEPFIKNLREETILYDGVIDDFCVNFRSDMKLDYLIQYSYFYRVTAKSSINSDHADYLNNKWAKYVKLNNITKANVKQVNRYFNIATPIIVEFLKEYGALEEATTVLYKQRKITHKKIQDNDLDKLLRKHRCKLSSFICNENTFCSWNMYELFAPKHISWCDLNDFLELYIKDNNILDIIP